MFFVLHFYSITLEISLYMQIKVNQNCCLRMPFLFLGSQSYRNAFVVWAPRDPAGGAWAYSHGGCYRALVMSSAESFESDLVHQSYMFVCLIEVSSMRLLWSVHGVNKNLFFFEQGRGAKFCP